MDEINDVRICELPDMRVLVSLIKSDNGDIIDDMGEGMRVWANTHGITSRPGMRENFAYFDTQINTFVFLQHIPDDFNNNGPYPDIILKGGLEAVVSGERDHLVSRYEIVMEWIDKSDRYELDIVDGQHRHPALCDWLTPEEVHQKFDFEQQDIFMPIRFKRNS